MASSTYFDNSSLIRYWAEEYEHVNFDTLEEAKLLDTSVVSWLNTYGLHFLPEARQVIALNRLDDFLLKLLLSKTYSNKVVELEGVIFITIRVLKTEDSQLDSETMLFISSLDFVWSIQEKRGDYFDWIRDRLQNNKGLARKKRADYLLFLILESIVDNYKSTFQQLEEAYATDASEVRPTPRQTSQLEMNKRRLFEFKRASISLRDTLVKLENLQMEHFHTHYFTDLKEQCNNLIQEIDFEIHELDSYINLIFSIQGHRLNEVMKTLTIFSVVFIPLTFIAGIYGMNFEYMPELQYRYGYFVALGVMALIAILLILYIARKGWFK